MKDKFLKLSTGSAVLVCIALIGGCTADIVNGPETEPAAQVEQVRTITKTVEVPVEVVKTVEVPVEVIKEVVVEVPGPVQYVDREVIKTVEIAGAVETVTVTDQAAIDQAVAEGAAKADQMYEQGFERGASTVQQNWDTAFATPCPTEDSANCYWDAGNMGNGVGQSFVDVAGKAYYFGG